MAVIDNLSVVYKKIFHAAMRAGREPARIRLVAVSKTVDLELMKEAVDAGVRVFGESRVQEAQRKEPEFRGMGVTWHMVGHLQKNKAKAAVRLFDLIHSVHSEELLGLLDRQAAEAGKVQKVLIQVSLAGEDSKSGVPEGGLDGIVGAARRMGNVEVEGLMTITPLFDDPEKARPYYRRLRGMAGDLGLPELSMGMTGDYEVAVEEGATLVRIGTAIFGERHYS